VYLCARGNRPRSAYRSTLAKASFVERDFVHVTIMVTNVKGFVTKNGTDCVIPRAGGESSKHRAIGLKISG
jgi:hypothetical protein